MNNPPQAEERRRAMLWTVLLAGATQAAAFGLYEMGLPLYMDHVGISALGMGLAFGLPHIGVVVVRYLAGSQSDIHGRKPFFVVASAASGVSALLIPAWPRPDVIGAIKTVRDSAGVVREVMRSIVLFELAGRRFVRWIGRAIGSEFIFMAAGALAAGVIIARLGYPAVFWASGSLSLASTALIWRGFREDLSPGGYRPGSAGRLLSPDLPRNLWILTAAMFVFNIGLTASHSFYLLLFFKDKFGFTITALTIIQILHRLSLGIPLVFTGQMVDRPNVARHYKPLCMAAWAVQGACISLAALIPNGYLACAVFLLHDIAGASLWSPIQSSFIQRFARPARRGQDVSLCSGLASLGMILGPPLAGYLIHRWHWIDGPYLVSGIITMGASLLILPLKIPADLEPPRASGE